MDLRKYDKLRAKLKTKDFEGKNKNLDKWLYRTSFFGNVISIFFAFFLVYPSLFKTISLQVVDGFWGKFIAFIGTTIFLSIFELIKRYLIRNFSHDYITNNRVIKPSIIGWFVTTIILIVLSFYLSVSGSKEFASTNKVLVNNVELEFKSESDSIFKIYNEKINELKLENNELNDEIDNLWNEHDDLTSNYVTRKSEIRDEIEEKRNLINKNRESISLFENDRDDDIEKHESLMELKKQKNIDNDYYNILLFIIIVVFNELLIVFGIYFREYYEYSLYLINNKRFEKIYLKRDRYRSLLAFIYSEGKLDIGDKVISGLELKELVDEKTSIQNSKKLVDEFLRDMDNLGIFTINGKRRHIAATYHEALTIIEEFDDAYRILENMK